ncbi:MAG: hypothetical protein PF448_03235 [Bacteroidales bacterium]|jgi:hypothetical protein|nr:hypothetical protein [Bacteroidales bacterium]
MKTQTLMIPLALFILMLLKSMGFGMVPPKKTANLSSLQSIEQQQILVSKYPNYPILSTKDYRPVQSVQNLVNEDVIEFYLNNEAIFSMRVDENGDCVQTYNNTECPEVKEANNNNDNDNVLENFRQVSKAFFKQSFSHLLNDSKQTENQDPEPTQSDKKYFMSDYR